MMANMRRVVFSAILVVSICVGPARATVQPLKRSVENFTQGPLDAVLAPFTTGQTTYRNMEADGGSTSGKVTLGAITYMGLAIRTRGAPFCGTGAGPMGSGGGGGPPAASASTDRAPPPFYDVKSTPALVDHPSDVFDVKFGVYHVGRSD